MESLSLRVDHVTVTYGNYRALSDISFGLKPGQYALVIGENGAGKSTLLRCAAAWQRPSSGTVSVLGHPVEAHERTVRQWIKLVPDTPQFYAELTAGEQVAWVARANRVREWQSLAEELMHAFKIAANQNAYPSHFSRGMQYKLALTMALVSHPKLLLLDEPFGPLDPYSQEYLAHRFREMADRGVTILASTHVLPDADPPDRVLALDQGAVIGDFAWSRLQADYFGTPPSALPMRVLRDLLTLRRPHDA